MNLEIITVFVNDFFKYSESLASEDELNDMEWCCIQNFRYFTLDELLLT